MAKEDTHTLRWTFSAIFHDSKIFAKMTHHPSVNNNNNNNNNNTQLYCCIDFGYNLIFYINL